MDARFDCQWCHVGWLRLCRVAEATEVADGGGCHDRETHPTYTSRLFQVSCDSHAPYSQRVTNSSRVVLCRKASLAGPAAMFEPCCQTLLCVLYGFMSTACHPSDDFDVEPAVMDGRDESLALPWDAQRACPMGFELRNELAGPELVLSAQDAPAGRPQPVLLSKLPTLGLAHAWKIHPTSEFSSNYYLTNVRSKNGLHLDLNTQDRANDPSEMDDPFAWRFVRSATEGVRVDSAQFRIVAVSDPTLAVAFDAETAALQIGPDAEVPAMLWTFTEHSLCVD